MFLQGPHSLKDLCPFGKCFFQGTLPQLGLVTAEVSVSTMDTLPHSFRQIVAQILLSLSHHHSSWLHFKKKSKPQMKQHKNPTNNPLMFYFGWVPAGKGREHGAALLRTAPRSPRVLTFLGAAVRAPELPEIHQNQSVQCLQNWGQTSTLCTLSAPLWCGNAGSRRRSGAEGKDG